MNEYRGLKYTPNVNPQGRARVFFCCYEKDFDRLFEPITAEILKIQQNATIWYYDPKEGIPDDENFIADLSRMQLFIVPITSGFLFKENNARNVEFKYAIEHHIPVLPLMQEPCLENDFNRICGDLQFLDKNASSNDPTALPYEDKLKKYLESVLVSDELAQRIRAAFDAYIFLSYRKKDRKYAQNIMRLIHKNEFCRDIAIWYDEFLIPGENFNDAIEDAMEKSKLFAMVVTPSLLEIPNYVRSVEYEAAKDLGKPVLPMEGQKTDSAKLSEVYSGIPETVGETCLPDYLLDWIHSIALKENVKDPEHNFLIGLAYLAGIDVEVNHERALKLITSAAEANLPEAYEKLVSMYQNGEGVERNYNTAFEWQKKYVNSLEADYEECKTELSLLKLINNIWSLGDYQYDSRKLDDAKSTFQKMLSYSILIRVDIKGKRYISISCNRLGDISKAEGKLKETRNWYLRGMEIFKALADGTNTVQEQRDLAISYSNLADISEAEGKTLEARDWFLKALKIRMGLAHETNTILIRRDLAISYSNLGNIYEDEGKLEEAKDWSLKGLEIFKAIADETNTAQAKFDLATSYCRLGDICEADGKTEEARVWFLKALKIRMGLAHETNTFPARRDLAISYNNLGVICKAEGKPEEARDWYLKSMVIFRELEDKTNTVQERCDLASCYNNLGNISKAEGKIEQAKNWCLKSLKIRLALAGETNTVQARRDLATSYNNLGNIIVAEGKLDKARNWYLKSMEILAKLADETNTVQAWHDLSFIYNNLGNICKDEGELEEAKYWYLGSLKILKQLIAEINSDEFLRDFPSVHEILKVSTNSVVTLAQEKKWFSDYITSLLQSKDEIQSVQLVEDLCIIYSQLGSLTVFTEDERHLYLKQAKELCEVLFRQTNLPKYQSLQQKMNDEKIKECCYNSIIQYINSGKDPNIVKAGDCPDALENALKVIKGVKSEDVCGIDYRVSGLIARKQYYILYTKTGIASNYSNNPLIRYDKINDIAIGKAGISISTFTGKRIVIDFKKANKSVYNFISEILKTIRRIRILD